MGSIDKSAMANKSRKWRIGGEYSVKKDRNTVKEEFYV